MTLKKTLALIAMLAFAQLSRAMDVERKEPEIFVPLLDFELPTHVGTRPKFRFSPDGQTLLTLSSSHPPLELWNAQNGELIYRFYQDSSEIIFYNFFKNNRKIMSAGIDGKIIIWDLKSKEIDSDFFHEGLTNAAIAPDDKKIISSDKNGLCKIWDLQTQELSCEFREHSGDINFIFFSPLGDLMGTFSKSGSKVNIYDINQAKHIKAIEVGKIHYARNLFYFNDKNTQLVKCDAGNAQLYDIDSGQLISELPSPHEGLEAWASFELLYLNNNIIVLPYRSSEEAMQNIHKIRDPDPGSTLYRSCDVLYGDKISPDNEKFLTINRGHHILGVAPAIPDNLIC